MVSFRSILSQSCTTCRANFFATVRYSVPANRPARWLNQEVGFQLEARIPTDARAAFANPRARRTNRSGEISSGNNDTEPDSRITDPSRDGLKDGTWSVGPAPAT